MGPDLLGGGRLARTLVLAGVLLGALALAACGSTVRASRTIQASSPASYRLQVTAARFPAHQRLAAPTSLLIGVRNLGSVALPDVSVTITNPRYGTAVQPFGTYLRMAGVEGHSRAVWVVDRPPGPCQFSCRAGGPGGAVTPETHTWSLGRLVPGSTAQFKWRLTPVAPGNFQVHYVVTPDYKSLVGAGRSNAPSGTFDVRISAAPVHETVADNGTIVKSN